MLNVGTSLGPYRILALLGAGGMGEVYRAHDPRLGRDVAIKVLAPHLTASPEARARFEREARTISQLSHPHICTLHDFGHEGDTDYLVMELLEGETLAHRLEKGPLPAPEVLSLGSQIADALDRAHRAGVVHRDLKPGNVMLTKSGVKLMDFGLARPTASAGPGARGPEFASESKTVGQLPTATSPLTAEGAIVGTFQYMAPEQLEGKDADARTDLWALGCVLYEIATGKRAFEGTSQASLIAAIMDHEPPPMTELQPLTPRALEHLVQRCLAKDPAERWQAARDVMHELRWVAAAGSEAEVPASLPTPRRSGRRVALWAAGSLAGALLVAMGYGFAIRTHQGTDPSRVAYTLLTVQRGTIVSARFSPDGKTVFYSAAWDGRPREVFETRPGFPTSRSLGLVEATLNSISRNGMMAVTLAQTTWGAGTLAEVSISGGAPRPILDDVDAADWTPDGKTLAVMRLVGGKARLEMPPGHVLYETSGRLTNVRVSRDGRFLAFHDHPLPADTRGSVVIIDQSGHLAARTPEWYSVDGLAWSTDGREVWYCVQAEAAPFQDLRAITPGGRERIVTRTIGIVVLGDVGPDGQVLLLPRHVQAGIRGRGSPSDEERELGWFEWSVVGDISADGRTLLFEEQGYVAGPQYAVCLRGMDGSPPVRLGEGRASALSPDGKWALSIRLGPPQRLLLYPTGTGDSTSLARGPIERYYAARWLPDGRGVILAASEAGHAQRTYVQDLRGGPPRPVTPEGIAGALVSPDGRQVAAVSWEQQLFVCPVDGGDCQPVARLFPDEIPVQWSTDGRSVYVRRAGASLNVDCIDIGAGRRVPWKTFRVPDPAGIRMGALVMTPDGAGYAYNYMRWLDDLYLVTGLK